MTTERCTMRLSDESLCLNVLDLCVLRSCNGRFRIVSVWLRGVWRKSAKRRRTSSNVNEPGERSDGSSWRKSADRDLQPNNGLGLADSDDVLRN